MTARTAAIIEGRYPHCAARKRRSHSALLALVMLTASPIFSLAETPRKEAQPESPAPKVDLQGDPLPAGAIARAGSARLRPSEFISQLVFSNDGKQLVSSAQDNAFCVWDAKSGRLIQRNDFYFARVHAANYSDSGQALAVVQSNDGQVHLWNFLREKEGIPPANAENPFVAGIRRVIGQDDMELQAFRLFAISDDGNILAGVASQSNEASKIQFWKIEPGKQIRDLKKLREIPEAQGYIDHIRIARNATRLVGLIRQITNRPQRADEENVQNNFAAVWDVESGKELIRFPLDNQSDWGFAVNEDATILAFGSRGDSIDLHSLETGELLHRLECFGWVRALAFSKSGRFLASGGRDQVVRLWDVEHGTEQRQFIGHCATVEKVAFSPDEQTIASGGQDGIIHLWDVASGKESPEPTSHAYKVMGLAYTRDGKLLFTGSWDDSVRVWDAQTGRLVRKMEMPNVKVNAVAVSSDGKLLAVGATQGSNALRVFNVASGEVVRSFPDQQNVGPNLLAFSSDAKWLVAGNVNEASVRVWDMATGKELQSFQHDEPTLNCLAISSNDKFIASAGSSKQSGSHVIRVWSTATGTQINEMASPKGGVDAIAFSADDTRLVSGGMANNVRTVNGNRVVTPAPQQYENAVQLWDLETGLVLAAFPGDAYREGYGTRYVDDVAVSPDGRLIATAERGGTVVLYQLEGAKRLATAKSGGAVRRIKFSGDGRRLASAGVDTSTLVWDVEAIVSGKLGETK
ncbi:MAG: WD40 repeat domain-containing protein [Planctomycetaceae bacterium]